MLRLLPFTLAASLLLGGTARAADTKERDECVAAAESGQVLRDRNKFLDATDAFSRCARATCPGVVKQDCARWLVELQEKTPTVSIRAQDEDGKDVADVAVTMDGAAFGAKLDGTPTPLDPGEHVFRFQAAGLLAVEQRGVYLAGDHGRTVTAVLKRPGPAVEPAVPTPIPGAVDTTAARSSPSALRGVAWVTGGAAVAAFATASVFGAIALSQRASDFGSGGCAPRCSSDEADGIHTKLVIADVAAGVGLAAAVVAVYAFIASRDRPTHAPVQPARGPALAGAGLRIAF